MRKGMLVIVDGPSGTGKDSLLLSLMKEDLVEGHDTEYISEEDLDKDRHLILEARDKGKLKGGSGDKEMARELIKHRAKIYRDYVNRRVDLGDIVLANRGETATLAYQTARGELSMENVWEMHRNLGIRKPDFVVITICDPELSIKREQFDRAQSSIRGEREKGLGLSGKITTEQGQTAEQELERRRAIFGQYLETADFLDEKGVRMLILNTGSYTVEEEVRAVKDFINR